MVKSYLYMHIMGRAWRIEYPGAIYHLLSRGNAGQEIFLSEKDRRLFSDTIAEFAERFEIDIFAYVFMPNHYHLMARTRHANLKTAMQWLGTTYTRRFNNRNSKQGHLFQGRYKSILVEDESYFIGLSCYIHRNPLRAGLVSRLIDYPWSSYPVYAYGKKGPEWLRTQKILSAFDSSDPHTAYRIKVQHYAKEETQLMEDLRHGFILGSEQFAENIRNRFLPETPQIEIPQQKKLAKDKNSRDQIDKAAATLGLDMEKCVQAGRLRGENKQKRDLLLYLMWNTGLMTNAELGNRFAMTYSAVSHNVASIKKQINQSKQLQSWLAQLNSQFKV